MAIHRINWIHDGGKDDDQINPYHSTGIVTTPFRFRLSFYRYNNYDYHFSISDPTPALSENNVANLKTILLDDKQPLWKRYRAMFALRNIGSDEAILAIADGKLCDFFLASD